MTTLQLPSEQALADAAAVLVQAAHDAGDRTGEHALNKAMWHLHEGLQLMPTTGGFLIPSGTREGVIHRISNQYGCSCEAGAHGRTCWHQSVLEIIEAAQAGYTPAQPAGHPIIVVDAIAEMDELFA